MSSNMYNLGYMMAKEAIEIPNAMAEGKVDDRPWLQQRLEELWNRFKSALPESRAARMAGLQSEMVPHAMAKQMPDFRPMQQTPLTPQMHQQQLQQLQSKPVLPNPQQQQQQMRQMMSPAQAGAPMPGALQSMPGLKR